MIGPSTPEALVFQRSYRLNILMSKLRTLTQTKNIAVLITNQCSANNEENEDPRPFGGNIVSYASTYIIYLKRNTALQYIKATSVKNPLIGKNTCRLVITTSGFNDFVTHDLMVLLQLLLLLRLTQLFL
ncbi:MAG TPA: hypothetical protein VFJ51_01685 [Nitrososphaeraceae archaeon]|nr:hypothetical protein [Nitrososphaeraceae archaeon]